MRLTPTQTRLLERVRAATTRRPQGLSVHTAVDVLAARALERRGLVVLTRRPVSVNLTALYVTLPSGGGKAVR